MLAGVAQVPDGIWEFRPGQSEIFAPALSLNL